MIQFGGENLSQILNYFISLGYGHVLNEKRESFDSYTTGLTMSIFFFAFVQGDEVTKITFVKINGINNLVVDVDLRKNNGNEINNLHYYIYKSFVFYDPLRKRALSVVCTT